MAPYLERVSNFVNEFDNQQRVLRAILWLGFALFLYFMLQLLIFLNTEPQIDDTTTEGYVLYLGWNPSSCRLHRDWVGKNCSRKPANEWTIRGFHPQPGSRTHCRSVHRFRANQMTSVMPRLETDWPNLFQTMSDEEYWRQAWLAHGSCSHHNFSTPNYFKKALEIYSKYPIGVWLAMEHIKPGSSKRDLKTAAQFKSTLRKHTGNRHSFALFCDKVKDKELYLISQIALCISSNEDVNNLRNCPKQIKSNCPDVFYFPGERKLLEKCSCCHQCKFQCP